MVRSHAEAAVAFAATGMPLEAVGHEGTLFVPPDIARFPGAGDLIRDPERAADLAHAPGDRNAVLLPRHGLVTVRTCRARCSSRSFWRRRAGCS